MKLLYCTVCNDVFAVRTEPRVCACGKSAAALQGDNIELTGEGQLIGIDSRSLAGALLIQGKLGDRPDGSGRPFNAFVVPDNAPKTARDSSAIAELRHKLMRQRNSE